MNIKIVQKKKTSHFFSSGRFPTKKTENKRNRTSMVPDVLRSLAKDTSPLSQCENNAAHKHKTSGPPF